MAVKNPDKGEIISEHALKAGDTGSTPVQIAILSQRIRHLTEHLRTYSKDHAQPKLKELKELENAAPMEEAAG